MFRKFRFCAIYRTPGSDQHMPIYVGIYSTPVPHRCSARSCVNSILRNLSYTQPAGGEPKKYAQNFGGHPPESPLVRRKCGDPSPNRGSRGHTSHALSPCPPWGAGLSQSGGWLGQAKSVSAASSSMQLMRLRSCERSELLQAVSRTSVAREAPVKDRAYPARPRRAERDASSPMCRARSPGGPCHPAQPTRPGPAHLLDFRPLA